MKKPEILLALVLIFFAASCDEKKKITSPEENENIFKGTITGKIFDICEGVPIKGATIEIGVDGEVKKIATDDLGSFSLKDVPITEYQNLNGSFIFSGEYLFTISLRDINLKTTIAKEKYRDYYYAQSSLKFARLDSGKYASLVAEVNIGLGKLKTKIRGKVLDQNRKPVAGAEVFINDYFFSNVNYYKKTETNGEGVFVFENIDNGLTFTIFARTKDGTQRGYLPSPLNLPCNVEEYALNEQFSSEAIVLNPIDDVNPYVISLYPENGADVETDNFKIICEFSESIKQEPYNTINESGYGGIVDDIALTYLGPKKATASNLPIKIEWQENYKKLIITPKDKLPGGAKFRLNLYPALSKLKDLSGNNCVNNQNLIGDFELLFFSTKSVDPVLTAPVLSRRMGFGYLPINYDGGLVGFKIEADSRAIGFNIYKKIDEGAWELEERNFQNYVYETNTGELFSSQNSIPFKAKKIHFKVAALNRDLIESPFSNIILIEDEVKPQITNVELEPFNDGWVFFIYFSEPMNIFDAENLSNYTFENVGSTIIEKKRANYFATGGKYQASLEIKANQTLPPSYILRIKGIRDLKGNVMVEYP